MHLHHTNGISLYVLHVLTIYSREEYHQLQQRSDTLKKILSSIPRVIDNRPVFLDVSLD